ncbi:MAG: type II CAAX endopeptidase family protein [Myxococcota bacterium]
MPDRESQPTAAALALSAVITYAVITLAGLVLMRWQDIDAGLAIFGASDSDFVLHAGLGVGTGLAVVGLTRLLGGWGPMRRLDDLLRETLGPLNSPTIAVLAVTSGVGEEVLFRGAIQPFLGLWLTALIFGLLHGGTMRRFRGWVVFAILAGLLFGALAQFTGDLLAPILCHFTVNYFNLHHLARRPA